jgi:hypothetical protein
MAPPFGRKSSSPALPYLRLADRIDAARRGGRDVERGFGGMPGGPGRPDWRRPVRSHAAGGRPLEADRWKR